MIPRLLKGKPASGLFREDVEIGVIARGNKLFRSVSGLLGWCLNLHLMDPFQGSSLVFFIKGGETLSLFLKHMTGARTPVELYHALLPVYHLVMLLQPRVAQDKRVFPEVGNFGAKFLPMSKKVDHDVNSICNVSCQVAGAVHIKDVYGVCKGFQHESHLFGNCFVNEGGVSSTVWQCGSDLELLRLGGDSNIDEELSVLVDSSSIDFFRDLVSDGGEHNLFLGFVDRMKHRVRAPAVLWSSQRCRLLGTRPI